VTPKTYDSEPLPVQAGNRLYYSPQHAYKHPPRCKFRPVNLLILNNWVYMDGYMSCNRKYTSEYIPDRVYGVGRVGPYSVLTVHVPPKHTHNYSTGHSTHIVITRLTCIWKVQDLNFGEHIEIFSVVHFKWKVKLFRFSVRTT